MNEEEKTPLNNLLDRNRGINNFEAAKIYKSIIENSNILFSVWDSDGKYLVWNKGAEAITGYDIKEIENKNKTFSVFFPDEKYRSIIEEEADKQITGVRKFPINLQINTKNNDTKLLELSTHHIIDEEGNFKGGVTMAFDVTERLKYESALNDSATKLNALINSTKDNILAIDKDKKITIMNENFRNNVYTFKEKKIELGSSLYDIIPDQNKEFWNDLFRKGFEGETINFEYKIEASRGIHYYDVSINPIKNDDSINGLAIYSRDISEKKRAEELLMYYATTDEMTGVINRRTGMILFEKQLEISYRQRSKIAVTFVDVNDLKYVNDNYGHIEGDELIKIASGILKNTIRKTDTVCRMGGDEFLIISPFCNKEEAEMIWDRIKNVCDNFNEKNQKSYYVTMSHGIAECIGEQYLTIQEMLNIADKNMYIEKRKHKTVKKQ